MREALAGLPHVAAKTRQTLGVSLGPEVCPGVYVRNHYYTARGNQE